MKLMDKVLDLLPEPVKDWSLQLAVKKVAVRLIGLGVTAAVSYITGDNIGGHLAQAGVTIDPQKLQLYLIGAGYAGFELGRNYVKVKFGIKFL